MPATVRALTSNLVPLLLAYAAMFALIQVGSRMEVEWLLLNGAELLAILLGLVVAWRWRARVATLLLLGFGAYSASLFAVRVIVGARAAQGGPTQVAVMAAGFLGVAAATLVQRLAPAAAERQ